MDRDPVCHARRQVFQLIHPAETKKASRFELGNLGSLSQSEIYLASFEESLGFEDGLDADSLFTSFVKRDLSRDALFA